VRKIVLLLILGGLLLAAAGCGGGTSSSNISPNTSSKSISVSSSVNEVIKEYFDVYFESQENLNYSKMSSSILADNENTKLSEAFRETAVAEMELFNGGISGCQYKLNYQSCSRDGDSATVKLLLDLDFQYKNAPTDVKSGIYGVGYTFTLKSSGDAWVITAIDSDLNEFQYFKAQVMEKLNQNTILSESEAVEKVKDIFKSNMKVMKNSSLYLNGASSAAGTPDASAIASSFANSSITKSVYVSCDSYNYDVNKAATYAVTYAQKDKDNRVFYTTRADCTNFASQCIWAGYIGHFNASIIRNKKGMIPTEWYAGTGGAATNWENVDKLWSYLTDSTKVAGPKGTKYVGTKCTNIRPSDINVGDLLQVNKGSGSDYDHSVFVTSKKNTVLSFDDILISSHTNDRKNYSLQTVINGFGGYYNCYIRRFTPQSGCYMKK
jgi:hypothetical protein